MLIKRKLRRSGEREGGKNAGKQAREREREIGEGMDGTHGWMDFEEKMINSWQAVGT